MSSIKDVAEEADVSTSTVSHVINGTRYVSPELKDKVNQAMERLNYKPNAVARSLKIQKTYTIGVILSDITNPFFSTLVKGIEDIASQKDHSIIVCNTDETLEKEESYIEELVRRKVEGLIIAPTGKSDKKLELLREQEIPFVFVDRQVDAIDADSVLSKNSQGAYEATNHLIQKGHQRIGIILGLESVTTCEERYQGYLNALGDANIEKKDELIVRGDYKVNGAMRATKKLLSISEPPTAIFATNNQTAIGTLKALDNSDLNWPKDIEVVSFDDFEWLELFDVPLPTVVQKPREMGEQAVDLLFRHLEGETNNEHTIKRLATTFNPRGMTKN